MKITGLKPAPYNPRIISPARKMALAASMEEFGDLSGIVYNRRTDRLISGHQRLKTIPPEAEIVKEDFSDDKGTVATGYIDLGDGNRHHYREVDWDEAREKAANLTANREFGEFDPVKLEEVLGSVEVTSFDQLDFGELLAPGTDELFPEIVMDQDDSWEREYEESTRFDEENTPENQPATDIKVSFNFGGKVKFRIDKETYAKWEEVIKKEVGFAGKDVCAEVVKRLGMEEYVNSKPA